eukprot:TRINITY_DN18620_c0_g1_i1.p1 TRINITY_DN18620_c0_g1~~TRINITY_DN18620_c0_g1_i1.p1  ORF type:complete len:457 (-),score=28.29 TRINITY_DN18620_c0_g1_i1:306-1655(-)
MGCLCTHETRVEGMSSTSAPPSDYSATSPAQPSDVDTTQAVGPFGTIYGRSQSVTVSTPQICISTMHPSEVMPSPSHYSQPPSSSYGLTASNNVFAHSPNGISGISPSTVFSSPFATVHNPQTPFSVAAALDIIVTEPSNQLATSALAVIAAVCAAQCAQVRLSQPFILPELLLCLSFLGWRDLVNAAQVSLNWKSTARLDSLWAHQCQEIFNPILIDAMKKHHTDCPSQYLLFQYCHAFSITRYHTELKVKMRPYSWELINFVRGALGHLSWPSHSGVYYLHLIPTGADRGLQMCCHQKHPCQTNFPIPSVVWDCSVYIAFALPHSVDLMRIVFDAFCQAKCHGVLAQGPAFEAYQQLATRLPKEILTSINFSNLHMVYEFQRGKITYPKLLRQVHPKPPEAWWQRVIPTDSPLVLEFLRDCQAEIEFARMADVLARSVGLVFDTADV